MVMTQTHTHKNSKFKGQSVQKIEWEQTDGRTDDCFTFPSNAGDNHEFNKLKELTRNMRLQFPRAST